MTLGAFDRPLRIEDHGPALLSWILLAATRLNGPFDRFEARGARSPTLAPKANRETERWAEVRNSTPNPSGREDKTRRFYDHRASTSNPPDPRPGPAAVPGQRRAA